MPERISDAHTQLLLYVGYDSFFPGGWGKRFILEERVPGETPQESRLLLDCKLNPMEGKGEGATFQHQ